MLKHRVVRHGYLSLIRQIWLKQLHEKTVGILLGKGGSVLGNSNMQLCVLFLVLNFRNYN